MLATLPDENNKGFEISGGYTLEQWADIPEKLNMSQESYLRQTAILMSDVMDSCFTIYKRKLFLEKGQRYCGFSLIGGNIRCEKKRSPSLFKNLKHLS